MSQTAQVEAAVMRPGTLIARSLVAMIGISPLCCLAVVVYFSIEAANLEFGYSVANRDTPSCLMPAIVAKYRDVYPLGWCGPIAGLVGLSVLVFRKTCTLGALVSYVTATILFTVVWLTYTLFVFYIANQYFWTS